MIALGSPKTAYYRQILMRANPTLHAEALRVIQNVTPSGAKIIDVGAGQGAFSLRLKDHGFNVVAVDTKPPDFRAKSVPITKLDFNSVSEIRELLKREEGKYDCVVGMEVIEHVENPWEYFRFLSKLAKVGGHILVTTPNTESAMSKIQFWFENTHAHFSNADFQGSGHINPLTMWELEVIASETNLEIVRLGSLCTIPKITISRNVRYMFYGFLNILFGWSAGRVRNGDILYLLVRKIAA
jgi:2-polyprenyl-3-methyl-5-hydroxy-6-metoxy-1,4-benzoquinol methylase